MSGDTVAQAGWTAGTRAAGLTLCALIFVLHVAHATGLRNLLAAMVAAWALYEWARKRQWPPLALPMLAWVVLCFASAAWSSDAETTLKSVVYDAVLPFGALWAAFVVARQAAAFRTFLLAAVAGIGVLAVLTLMAYLAGMTDLLADEGRAGLLYYYPGPGVASTLSVFALPLALLLLAEDAPVRRIGYLALACALAAGLGSLNRMFMPSATLVLAAVLAWHWPRLSVKRRTLAVAGLLAGTLAALGVIALQTQARATPPPPIDIRLDAWREWMGVAREAPLLGHGFGRKILATIGKERLSSELAAREPHLRSHAHNLFLDVVLQVGVVGLAIYCWLLAALAREAWRARDMRQASGALAALLVGVVVKNATDDFMHLAVAIAFWAYAGLLLGRLALAKGASVPR